MKVASWFWKASSDDWLTAACGSCPQPDCSGAEAMLVVGEHCLDLPKTCVVASISAW